MSATRNQLIISAFALRTFALRRDRSAFALRTFALRRLKSRAPSGVVGAWSGRVLRSEMAVVETDRLTLRPPVLADVRPMFEIHQDPDVMRFVGKPGDISVDRKSTRLNSSHSQISYAVF